MTLDEEARRGRAAADMVNSDLFQQARKHLEGQLAQLRRQVPIHQTEMHTRLIEMEQLQGHFFAWWDQLVQTGKFADLQLQDEARRRTWREQAMAVVGRFGRNAF